MWLLAVWPAELMAQTTGEKISAAAADTGEKLQEAGKAAKDKVVQLWEQLDAKRLKNRTPDELVAWAIMGLLVGGVLARFTRLKPVTALILGLVGAFAGGIVAHLTQFDLGLGPVLIRYEDLLFALVGGLLLVLLARWFTARKAPKA